MWRGLGNICHSHDSQATCAVPLLLADLAMLTAAERSDFGQELNAA